jgi:hypothetical protein
VLPAENETYVCLLFRREGEHSNKNVWPRKGDKNYEEQKKEKDYI